MAAVTQSANRYGLMGDKYVVYATFTNPIDTNTWDTGLRVIDGYSVSLEEAAAAADAITVTSVSGGTLTLEIDGTVGSARAFAFGC